MDHQQTQCELDRELQKCQERDKSKYNFDFAKEQPINSPNPRYDWSKCGNKDTKVNKK